MLADLVFVLCSYFFHVDFIQIVSILVLSDPSVYVNLTLSRRLKKILPTTPIQFQTILFFFDFFVSIIRTASPAVTYCPCSVILRLSISSAV